VRGPVLVKLQVDFKVDRISGGLDRGFPKAFLGCRVGVEVDLG
jgi:hypothetical protein